jgi:hypothetical protein
MPSPSFDILRRQADGSFIWVEAVADLETARAHLKDLFAKNAADYFVFDQRSQQIVARLANRPGGEFL